MGNTAESLTPNTDTLCSNWRYGCNGVAESKDGNLTLCDDCSFFDNKDDTTKEYIISQDFDANESEIITATSLIQAYEKALDYLGYSLKIKSKEKEID